MTKREGGKKGENDGRENMKTVRETETPYNTIRLKCRDIQERECMRRNLSQFGPLDIGVITFLSAQLF